jgi:hypothetical protein
MVEFRLPKNSRIRNGKVWPKPDSPSLQEFLVYRWNPDDGFRPGSTPTSSTELIADRWSWTGLSGSKTTSIRH